jgi:hypothetical protein
MRQAKDRHERRQLLVRRTWTRAPPRPCHRCLPRVLWALTLAIACGAPEPGPRREEARTGAHAAPPDAASADPPPAPVTSPPVAAYPSLAHYPSVAPTLTQALARRDGVAILAGLDDTLRPYRWPDAMSWDNTGYVNVAGPGPLGWARRVGEAVLAQDDGTHDLGCAGGFLEGMRLLWLPTLAIEELGDCTTPVDRGVTGAALDCDQPSAWGLVAIANLAARLPMEALPHGRVITKHVVTNAATAAELRTPGVLHLCTLSHTSRRAPGRWHHHMMAIGADPQETILRVFDTTGIGGVSWRQMTAERLHRYTSDALASNAEYRYERGTAELHCVATTMPTQ